MKPAHTACRIAVVCPWFYRGDAVGHSAHDYYRALRALGHTQVRAIGTRNDFPDMSFERCGTLDELVRNEWYANADLVIYHYAIYHELFEALRRKPRGGRHVVCFHNVTPRHLMPESTWDIIDKSFAQLVVFDEADEIWGDSRENIEELKRRGIRRPPMREIPIAVERPPLMALTDKRHLPIELLYVGRFFSSKGTIDLVDAISRLRHLVSRPFLLRLVGNTDFSDRDYVEAVGARIRLHGLGEQVDFVGKVDEPTLFRLYHRAHVFVNASYHEGFCVPVIESLRGGLIPVTYRAGNLRWIAGGHGRTVETGDVEALATALAEIVEAIGAALERPDEPLLPLDNGRKTAVQFSAEAKEYARKFEFKQFTERLDDALREVLARSQAAEVPQTNPRSEMIEAHPLQFYPGYEPADLAVFEKFRGAYPKAEPGFIVDYLGVRTRASSLAEVQREFAGKLLGIPVPGDFHAEAIEYIGLLKSVLAAPGRYVIMELGAGWGPWLVSGGVAARQLGIKDIRMYGVEADEGHFVSMQRHLRDNGFDPVQHHLYHAAVGASGGKAVFPKVADHANQWGARPAAMEEGRLARADVGYLGALLTENVEVDVLPINELLEHEKVWDLVHIDVQGWEGQICAAGIDNLNRRARYLIIGTHSRKLDGDLIALFHRSGWILEHEKPTKFRFVEGVQELESMTLADGTQVWRNPRL